MVGCWADDGVGLWPADCGVLGARLSGVFDDDASAAYGLSVVMIGAVGLLCLCLRPAFFAGEGPIAGSEDEAVEAEVA